MVLSESKAALTALSELAPRFNAATDSFMEELRAIEATLEKLKIGLTCELATEILPARYEEQEDENGNLVTYQYISCLAYERLTAGWGLTVRDYRGRPGPPDTDGEYVWTLILITSLLNSAREMRIAAAPLIPKLLDALVGTTTESLHALTAVADTSAREKSPGKKTVEETVDDVMRKAGTMRQ